MTRPSNGSGSAPTLWKSVTDGCKGIPTHSNPCEPTPPVSPQTDIDGIAIAVLRSNIRNYWHVGKSDMRFCMSMKDKVEELLRRRAEAKKMGGEARLARQKERGKLDARARLDLLLDPGTFREIGVLATHLGRADGATPADGVVCGTGMVDARPACVASYYFTVQGGSIGPCGE